MTPVRGRQHVVPGIRITLTKAGGVAIRCLAAEQV